MHILKLLRVVVAMIVFVTFFLYLVDFIGLMPDYFRFLPRLQWVPALLMVTPIVSALFLMSLFFGRLFCSTLCPLGVLQDILIRINLKLQRKKRFKYEYQQTYLVVRYGILLLTLLSFFSGTAGLLLWLDPYSNFGRLIASIFRPVFIGINNGLADILGQLQIYSFPVYRVEIVGLTVVSVLSSLLLFVILIAFTWRHGRMYCNVICPVGTFLGLIAKVSLFRVKIDRVKCTGCGACGAVCKGGCIDPENHTIDVSRCVSCFNCLKVCNKDAIKYQFVLPSSVKDPVPAYMGTSRRRTFRFVGLLATSAFAHKALAKNVKTQDPASSRKVIMPPGAQNKNDFTKKCTACQLCVMKCPSHVLQPATFQYGLDGIMQPRLNYKQGYCNYNCTTCMEVCPTGALNLVSLDDKRLTKVGEARLRIDLCIVTNQQTDCGACAEHCPTQAVRMVPYHDGLTIPSLDPSLCIGCGGCEFICPVRPFQAIYVEGLDLQYRARQPKEEKRFEEEVTDFGF